MVDMQTWPDEKVNVLSDLSLDPRNVRLDIDVEAPEVDIIRDLFANERVLSLVEGIARVGYLTHEIPIVVKRDGRLVVVEGNRRVAALKAIQNPNLAADYKSRVSNLADRIQNRDALTRITVRVAPSQDLADQVIAAIHTSNLRRPWSPARQAAFFQAQVDAGGTLPELVARYPTADVRRFVFRSLVLNLFRNAPYSDPELRDYVRKRSFSVSTLARVYESARFINALGLNMSDSGRLTYTVPTDTFNNIAEYIIEGMKAGSYSTRTLNTTTSAAFVALMEHIDSVVAEAVREPAAPSFNSTKAGTGAETGTGPQRGPQRRNGSNSGIARDSGAPTSSEPQSKPDVGPIPPDAGPTPAPDPRPPRPTRVNLQTSQFIVPDWYPNAIKYSFAELASLNVVRHPNAALDLLRSFLEKTIKAYAEHQSKRIPAGAGGMVQLSQCLTWLEGELRGTPLVAVIKRLQSGRIKEYALSAAYLNELNHNQNIFATSDQVHEVWTSMDGLLRLMLR